MSPQSQGCSCGHHSKNLCHVIHTRLHHHHHATPPMSCCPGRCSPPARCYAVSSDSPHKRMASPDVSWPCRAHMTERSRRTDTQPTYPPTGVPQPPPNAYSMPPGVSISQPRHVPRGGRQLHNPWTTPVQVTHPPVSALQGLAAAAPSDVCSLMNNLLLLLLLLLVVVVGSQRVASPPFRAGHTTTECWAARLMMPAHHMVHAYTPRGHRSALAQPTCPGHVPPHPRLPTHPGDKTRPGVQSTAACRCPCRRTTHTVLCVSHAMHVE
jgi:hypothetical protein